MSIRPRDRFEILKRDGFACQYCGRKAPEVQLAVDHIVPRSKGGDDSPDNLQAACVECNSGKAARFIDGTEDAVDPLAAITADVIWLMSSSWFVRDRRMPKDSEWERFMGALLALEETLLDHGHIDRNADGWSMEMLGAVDLFLEKQRLERESDAR